MNYIDWHYFHIWTKILLLWKNSVLFPCYYFCIPLHLTTLFSPWHKQYAAKKIGFHLDDVISVVIFNVFARIIGAIMRTITVFYGLLFMIIDTVVFLIPVIIWPILIGISLPFYLTRKLEKGDEVRYLIDAAGRDINKLAKILFKQPEGKFVTSHLGLNPDVILNNVISSDKYSHPALDAGSPWIPGQARNDNNSVPEQLILADLYKNLAENFKPFVDLLAANNLKPEDVYQTALWYEDLKKRESPPLIFDLSRIKNLQGIGHDWAYGYTVEMDKYSKDLTRKIPIFPTLLHRDNELSTMQRILLKTEGNNPLIVGEPGIARHLLAEILAYRIKSGETDHQLSHKRVLSLNMHSLVSAKPSPLEVKGLADELLEEAKYAGNIIICIDEIDKYLSEGPGRIDLTDVIVKLAQSPIGIVGITNPSSYYKYIKSNSTLAHLFEKVEVEPLDKEKTMDVLKFSISPVLERKYRLTITYPALKKVIEDADRYVTTDPFPSKANELLDEACVWQISHPETGNRHSGLDPESMGIPHQACTELVECVRDDWKILTASDIDNFLTQKLHMNIGNMDKIEGEKLANLENLLHERIINQEQAIKVLSSALRRSRLNIGNPNKPVGSFLFLGPTGVGKTETAKALACVYYGTGEKLIRFDMSQYQKEEGLERLIGSMKMGLPGELTSKISEAPFSVLLLDEFEKSDKQIYNLFLTLLDEGYINDATGKKVMVRNNIIIATSNAGGEFIRERLQQGLQEDLLQKELLEYVQREKIFSPELLNRFDAVVVFTPLSEGNLREVARLMLDDLNKRLIPKELSINVTPDLIRKLAAIGFDPIFGARAMRRTITEKIEDEVAQKLLAGEAKKGEKIEIDI